MKKMHIFRHDEAHRIIINAINKGEHGSYFMIADVGKKDTLQQIGVHHKRIPNWILPDSSSHGWNKRYTETATTNKTKRAEAS